MPLACPWGVWGYVMRDLKAPAGRAQAGPVSDFLVPATILAQHGPNTALPAQQQRGFGILEQAHPSVCHTCRWDPYMRPPWCLKTMQCLNTSKFFDQVFSRK